jgi:hypothetical protein
MTEKTRITAKKPDDFKSVARRLGYDPDMDKVPGKLGKIAKSRVAGRMPARSEAMAGDESEGLTPVATAQEAKPGKIAKVEKIAKAKDSKSPKSK